MEVCRHMLQQVTDYATKRLACFGCRGWFPLLWSFSLSTLMWQSFVNLRWRTQLRLRKTSGGFPIPMCFLKFLSERVEFKDRGFHFWFTNPVSASWGPGRTEPSQEFRINGVALWFYTLRLYGMLRTFAAQLARAAVVSRGQRRAVCHLFPQYSRKASSTKPHTFAT